MADISKIKLNGVTYSLKDETARANSGISETAANAIYLRLDGTNAPTAEYHWNTDFISENGVYLNATKDGFIAYDRAIFWDENTGRTLGFQVDMVEDTPIITVIDGGGGAKMPLYGAYASDDNDIGYFVTDTYLKSAGYANDAGFIKKTGDTMSGTLSLNNNKITAVATPTGNSDAANKSYVDNSIPTALKNPNSISFTGASVATYDGSSAVTVNIPVIPTSLKNPNKLSFTGAVNTTYDGSAAVSVAITQVKLKSWTAADFT